jgi:hypothetical protein
MVYFINSKIIQLVLSCLFLLSYLSIHVQAIDTKKDVSNTKPYLNVCLIAHSQYVYFDIIL